MHRIRTVVAAGLAFGALGLGRAGGPAAGGEATAPAATVQGRKCADLKPGEWVTIKPALTDRTANAAYSSRSWNNMRQDPETGRFYVWEGWNSTQKSGFAYTPRGYHIYSDALYSFALPESAGDGQTDLVLENLTAWMKGASGWEPRDPAKDHPRMKVPSPKHRHPFDGTAFDAKRRGLWQYGGVESGAWFGDLWFYDVAKGEWKEFAQPQPPGGYAVNVTWLPDHDALLMRRNTQNSELWEYSIARNQWSMISSRFPGGGSLIYDAKRKRCHSFASQPGPEKAADGKPVNVVRLVSYDPTARKVELGEPAKSPEGLGRETALDAGRDRLVSLTVAAKDVPQELWAYDFAANAFAKVSAGGKAPVYHSSNPQTLTWDCRNDLYVAWRFGTIHVLRPGEPEGKEAAK